jgi:signal transduction histidine kinase
VFRARRRLRLRIAIEFMLIATVIDALLVALVLSIRSGQLHSEFDADLVLRARAVAGMVERADEAERVERLHAWDESEPSAVTWYQVQDPQGRVLASSAALEAVVVPRARRTATPGRPVLETVGGERFGHPGEFSRVASVAVPGPGRPAIIVRAASSLAATGALVSALARLLFLFVLPGAGLIAGVSAFFVGDRLFRRIDQITAAAARISSSPASGARLEVPATRDEIGDMVAQMNALLSRLEAAYAAQDKFIMDVTHELKTPVSALFGHAQILLSKSPAEHGPEFAGFVRSVTEEMRGLGNFLESLLTLLRAGHGKFVATTPVDLDAVAVEAADRWGPEARSMGVTVLVEFEEGEAGAASPVLRGDHDMLINMVVNMMMAVAVQAARPGMVELSVSRGSGEVILRAHFRDPVLEARRPAQIPANPRRVEVRAAVAMGVAQIHGGEVQVRAGEHPEAVARLPVTLRMSQAG